MSISNVSVEFPVRDGRKTAHVKLIMGGDGDPTSFTSRQLAAYFNVSFSMDQFEQSASNNTQVYKFGGSGSLQILSTDRGKFLEVRTKDVYFMSKQLFPSTIDELNKVLTKIQANAPARSTDDEDPQAVVGGRKRRTTLRQKKRHSSGNASFHRRV